MDSQADFAPTSCGRACGELPTQIGRRDRAAEREKSNHPEQDGRIGLARQNFRFAGSPATPPVPEEKVKKAISQCNRKGRRRGRVPTESAAVKLHAETFARPSASNQCRGEVNEMFGARRRSELVGRAVQAEQAIVDGELPFSRRERGKEGER